MTTPMSINRISEVNFEEGFTGNGKVFIEVQKQADNSEKLVVYEANNALTAFFSNLFRIRSKTFTARECAANIQGGSPEKIDKEKLVQNIKQAASKNCIESAPQILNKLVADKKLDAPEAEVSKYISALPLGRTSFAIEIEKALHKLSDTNNLSNVITEVHYKKTDGKVYAYFFEGDFSEKNPPPLPENFVSFVQFYSPTTVHFDELNNLNEGTFLNIGQPEDIKTLFKRLGSNEPETGLRDHRITKNLADFLNSAKQNQIDSADTHMELTLLTKLLLDQEKKHLTSSSDSSRLIRSLELTLQKLDSYSDPATIAENQT